MARLPVTQSKTLSTYCKVCSNTYQVSKERIFSGREYAKYATLCPICGYKRFLPFKDVEDVFGELKL